MLKKRKRLAFKEYASNLNYKSDPTHFWNTIKRFKSKWVNITNEAQDSIQQEIKEQVAVNKICPPWVPDSPPREAQTDQCHLFLDQPFNYSECINALERSKPTTAPGPDGIDNAMIKSLSDKCKLLLLDILNDLYQSHTIPEDWKQVHVFLIPKHSNNTLRPIRLSSCLCKLMERLLNHRLLWWVEHNGFLPPFQCGFRKSRSCSDNIGLLITIADTGYRTNKYTAAVLLDINSASDNVQRHILLQQFYQLRITRNLTRFISNCMQERHVRFIGSSNLEQNHRNYTIHKGLPQGGVLSPLLSNLYIHNIMANVPCDIKITQYADDIVLIARNNDPDVVKILLTKPVKTIQANLQGIGLELATEKPELLCFGNSPRKPANTSIHINNTIIHSKPVYKFLGVHIDNRLNFHVHTEHVIKQCNKSLNVIRFLRGSW